MPTREPQEGPKRATASQDSSKMVPRGPQETPRDPQENPKRDPRDPKTPQERPNEAAGALQEDLAGENLQFTKSVVFPYVFPPKWNPGVSGRNANALMLGQPDLTEDQNLLRRVLKALNGSPGSSWGGPGPPYGARDRHGGARGHHGGARSHHGGARFPCQQELEAPNAPGPLIRIYINIY